MKTAQFFSHLHKNKPEANDLLLYFPAIGKDIFSIPEEHIDAILLDPDSALPKQVRKKAYRARKNNEVPLGCHQVIVSEGDSFAILFTPFNFNILSINSISEITPRSRKNNNRRSAKGFA